MRIVLVSLLFDTRGEVSETAIRSNQFASANLKTLPAVAEATEARIPQVALSETKEAMPPIAYYGIDESLKTVKHGVVSKEEALQIVDKFSAMQVDVQG